MNVFVCDANILIDLLQVDLFNAFLKLKWGMRVRPDVIDELREANSDQFALTAKSVGAVGVETTSVLTVKKVCNG